MNTAATTLAPAPDAAEREAKAAWSETSDDVKGPGGQKYPEGVGGQPDFPGHHNLDGYVGGSTRAKEETASSGMGLRGPSEPSNSTGSSGQIAESDNNSAPTENTFKGEGGSSSVDAAPRPSGPSSSTGSSGQIAGSDNKSAPTENTFKGEGDSSVNAAPGYVGSVVSEANRTGKPKGKNITEGGFDDDPSKNASFNSDIGSEDDPGMKAIGDMQRKTQNVSGGTGPRQAPGDSDNSQYDVLETDQQL